MTALARSLDLDAGTISGLLSRMEREGLVERRRSSANRAEVHVVLTRSGRTKWNKSHERLAAADRRLVRAIGKERLAALQETVAILGELTQEKS